MSTSPALFNPRGFLRGICWTVARSKSYARPLRVLNKENVDNRLRLDSEEREYKLSSLLFVHIWIWERPCVSPPPGSCLWEEIFQSRAVQLVVESDRDSSDA